MDRARILTAAQAVKANARHKSRETAKSLNRHLLDGKRWKDADLEVEVDKWFDSLDLNSVAVIQRVFPGNEALRETLKVLNNKPSKPITRGHLVASISPEIIAQDIRDLLISVGKQA